MAEGRKNSRKNELLLAGVQELNEHGIVNFSVRRIAEKCGVSPGAPYRHFHNREEFIAAIINYNYAVWEGKLQNVIDAYPGDYRKQLTEIIITYVCFLVENPQFRSLLMIQDDSFDDTYRGLRRKLTSVANERAEKYREWSGMDEKIFFRKKFVLRSIMYGAALMFGNGEMDYTPENIESVRRTVDREFDLP